MILHCVIQIRQHYSVRESTIVYVWSRSWSTNLQKQREDSVESAIRVRCEQNARAAAGGGQAAVSNLLAGRMRAARTAEFGEDKRCERATLAGARIALNEQVVLATNCLC